MKEGVLPHDLDVGHFLDYLAGRVTSFQPSSEEMRQIIICDQNYLRSSAMALLGFEQASIQAYREGGNEGDSPTLREELEGLIVNRLERRATLFADMESASYTQRWVYNNTIARYYEIKERCPDLEESIHTRNLARKPLEYRLEVMQAQ